MLEIRLSGRFEVKLDGRPVTLPSRPAQSLFAYLALSAGTAHRRERLAGLLWPDSSDDNARRNLRQSLWHIRKALGEAAPYYLFSNDITVTFAPDPPAAVYWLDVALLEKPVDANATPEELMAVVAVYGGELLPGFYDDWVVWQRERQQTLFERKMEQLLDKLTAVHRWDDLLEWGERWLAHGQTPEAAYRALMVAHAGRGDLLRMATVYRRCVDALDNELGVEPSAQTQALYERLAHGEAGDSLAAALFPPRYQILDEVGRGGMGVVYQAHDTRLARDVAIKILSPNALDADGRARLLREAQAIARLNHPNIVTVFDAGEVDGRPFIVMELMPGHSLRHHEPQNLDECLHITRQICLALEHAHDHGVIHRDLKPENILITSGQIAKLMDFGLSPVASSPRLTQTGAMIGTPYYLSPEAYNGEPIGKRADIWALGIILFEMLAGIRPFTGNTLIAIMKAILTQPVPDLRQYQPEIPADLVTLIQQMLEKDITQRIASVQEVRAKLEAISQGREAKKQTGDLQHKGTPAEVIGPVTAVQTVSSQPLTVARLFISYKRYTNSDTELALYLHQVLTAKGYEIFLDSTLRTGTARLEEIDYQIRTAHFFIVLLSRESADSEMVQAEVQRAYNYHKQQGHPHLLPIRLAYSDLLPYSIDTFLDPFQYVLWQNKADNEQVVREILAAIYGQLPRRIPLLAGPPSDIINLSEDGRPFSNDKIAPAPLPEFDPRYVEDMVAPGGTVRLSDKLYIEREADKTLKRQILRPGSITTIRASRQTGKSSLLVRGIQHARQYGTKMVSLDLQRVDREQLSNSNTFLRYLADFMVRKLHLDAERVEKIWQGTLGSQDKLTYLLEDYILTAADAPIIFTIDEADRLVETNFHTDFFGLIRSWHNSTAYDTVWEKLNIVMVISTEPYLLIADINQSPFNVGLKLYLEDFTFAQVSDLNRRHGEPIAQNDFDQFMSLLHGHPYLTRKALYTLVTGSMTWDELHRVAASDSGPFSDHLRHQLWLLRNEVALQATLKEVIRKNRASNEMALFRLLRAGLVSGTGTFYTCRCELYHHYFQDRL